MPTYTVEAFRWSGTGYNALYNTSYSLDVTDNDPDFQGGSDADESVSANGGTAGSTNSTPFAIDISFTDVLGNPHVETFFFINTSAAPSGWYFTLAPGSVFTVGATLGTYQSHTSGWAYSSVVCFAQGTLIETDLGPIPVENLEPDALIALANGGFSPLRLNLLSAVSAEQISAHDNLRPVFITAGALGAGLPKRDLRVSRQHRMQVNSPITKHMFGEDGVLVAAIRLTDILGIYVEETEAAFNYYHLVFDRHQVIIAEGTPTESFYTVREAIAALNPEARGEVLTLFPQLARKSRRMKPACMIPARISQKQLIARHIRNAKPLISAKMTQSSLA
ncbi:Hint domain-containing protein [Planktotalea sp.]|uniref:Hint domain-containing protein n=1 Tax=Planktotalea sp. TaxID=2029877 RepID=UPI0025FE68CC|nr:Hint domain-containing protein [Planktotalea sp.]